MVDGAHGVNGGTPINKHFRMICHPSSRGQAADSASWPARSTVFIFILAFALVASASTPAHVSVSFEQPIGDAHYPELVYWFITPETFAPGRVAQDIHHIANDTRFTFAFLTERNGVLLLKNPQPKGYIPPSCPKWPPWCTPFSGNAGSHALTAEIVKDAHRNGIKIGLTFDWHVVDTTQLIPLDEDQTVISSAEAISRCAGPGNGDCGLQNALYWAARKAISCASTYFAKLLPVSTIPQHSKM